jgi:RNA polymerase sigma factor (TIGR02999 family)
MESTLNELFTAAEAGSEQAIEQLFAALYGELHRLAEHNLRNAGAPATLGATTLLHEAYLNISHRDELAFPNEGSFLSYASRAMRGLVVDYARKRRALKRGKQFEVTLLDDQAASGELNADELERLSDALDELARLDRQLSELVDLHFFCGYTFAEIARGRGVSERTVQRDWRKARVLLHESVLTREPDT